MQQARLIIYKQKFLGWHIAYKYGVGWRCVELRGIALQQAASDTGRQAGVCRLVRASTRRRSEANGWERRCNPVWSCRRSACRHEELVAPLQAMPSRPYVILIKGPEPAPSMIQTPPPDVGYEWLQRRRIALSSMGYAPCPVWPGPYGMLCPDSRPAERHAVGPRTRGAGAFGLQAPAQGRYDGNAGGTLRRFFPHRPRAPLKLNVTHGDDWQARLSAPLVRPHYGLSALEAPRPRSAVHSCATCADAPGRPRVLYDTARTTPAASALPGSIWYADTPGTTPRRYPRNIKITPRNGRACADPSSKGDTVYDVVLPVAHNNNDERLCQDRGGAWHPHDDHLAGGRRVVCARMPFRGARNFQALRAVPWPPCKTSRSGRGRREAHSSVLHYIRDSFYGRQCRRSCQHCLVLDHTGSDGLPVRKVRPGIPEPHPGHATAKRIQSFHGRKRCHLDHKEAAPWSGLRRNNTHGGRDLL